MVSYSSYYPVQSESPRSDSSDKWWYSTNNSKNMVKAMKKWELHPGRNRFCCNGRIMMAQHIGVFYFTVALIVNTSIMFFIFDCPYLGLHVSWSLPVIAGLLFIFVMATLFRTSCTDPGVIPRATPEEAADIERQIEVPNGTNSPTFRPPPRTKEVIVKGQVVKLKYCFTCKIFRPPRASHCGICNNCVERFDHHCPWVGNCVGKRNYRYFYMFISSLAVYCVFILVCVVTHLVMLTNEEKVFLYAIKQSPGSLVVGLICFLSTWSIVGLAGFHTYLVSSNQTTNEDIKGSFTVKRGQEPFNPYSHANVCLNCFEVLCGPMTPSLLDSRGVVTPEYQQVMAFHHKEYVPSKTYGTVPEIAGNGIPNNHGAAASTVCHQDRSKINLELQDISFSTPSQSALLSTSTVSNGSQGKSVKQAVVNGVGSASYSYHSTPNSRPALFHQQTIDIPYESALDRLDLDSIDGTSQTSQSTGSQVGLVKMNAI